VERLSKIGSNQASCGSLPNPATQVRIAFCPLFFGPDPSEWLTTAASRPVHRGGRAGLRYPSHPAPAMPKNGPKKPAAKGKQAADSSGADGQSLAAAKRANDARPTGMAKSAVGAPLVALAVVACAAAVLLGSGLLMPQSGPATAARRAELEKLKLPELVSLVDESSILSESELDAAMEADDPKSALIAALLELRGLDAFSGALGLTSASQPAATCGAVLLLTDGPDCHTARCTTVIENYAQVRDAAVSSTDVLQFVTVNAQTEPAFATRVTQIGSRGDLGWANSSLPLLYFTKTRTDLRAPAEYDAEGDRLISALITGEEVPDAYSYSPFTLSAYLRNACGDSIVSDGAFGDADGTPQHKLAAAVQDGDITLLRKLLAQATGTPVPTTSNSGSSECGHRNWRELCWEPLHAAFRWWKPEYGVPGEVITALLEAGMSITAVGASGHTVLHRLIFEWGLAATKQNQDPTPLMVWILDHPDCDLMQVDNNQQTVLHMAGASVRPSVPRNTSTLMVPGDCELYV
jgi:hypothetical protein